MKAGGTAAFIAPGDGSSGNSAGSGNVTIAGSNVNASDVVLSASNQVNLVNTTDTDSTRSTNQSSSASVGVSYGTQGFGVSASMSKAHGDANSDAALQNNTHVNGANSVRIVSGGDTNLIGSNVSGGKITADIGGNLNIASVQDTTTSSAHQTSTGGGFSISQGGGSAGFSHSSGSASSSYASVNEQAGIQASSGGFDIHVKGNTDLKGAVIASDADASKNSLATGTLTFSDIQNRSSHDAHSGGFSGGATTGDGGTNYSTHGPSSGKNAGGAASMLSQDDRGSDLAMTRSGISAGTINVTDSAHPAQDIASLNRDTSDANGTVAKTPDVNTLLNNQADMMSAASAAGEAVSRRIGDYAESKKNEAEAAGDTVGFDAWKEGGANRAMMQTAAAALVTGLGGGNAIAGAGGAGVASIAAGKLNNLNSAIADPSPSGNASVNEALGNIVANVIATGAGAAVGGDAGAFSAYSVDRFNRQLHPDEKKWINDRGSAYAKRYGLTSEQAHHELTTQANLQVQNGSPGQWNQRASDFLSQAHGMLPADGNSGPGYMFYATPAQKAEPSIYARYYPNGERLNQPAAGDVVNSANRDALNRAAYTKATTSAAALAGGIVIAGPIAVLPGTPIFSVGGRWVQGRGLRQRAPV